MVKSRMRAVDVRAMVSTIRPQIKGLRLANIYDINSKVYVLKFARGETKHQVLLEAGIRFHITEWKRDKSAIPSGYTMKLRKHLRTRRLEDVRQLGADRVVDFVFGASDGCFHLILELYVSGNLILTDHEYNILILLRSHTYEGDIKVAVKQKYPVELAAKTSLLAHSLDPHNLTADALVPKLQELLSASESQPEADEEATDKKRKKKGRSGGVGGGGIAVKEAINQLVPFADPVLIHHCLMQTGVGPKTLITSSPDDQSGGMAVHDAATVLVNAINEALLVLRSLSIVGDVGGPDEGEEETERDIPGWITYTKTSIAPSAEAAAAAGADAKATEAGVFYDEFLPFLFAQYKSPSVLVKEFSRFDLCVDHFFSQIESQKVEKDTAQKTAQVYSKVDKIRVDQQRRVEQLAGEQELSDRQASLIEQNTDTVEQAIMLMRTALATGVDWQELWTQIKYERRNGHPVAAHFHALELSKNTIHLLLGDNADDVQEDKPMLVVPIDLSLSAHGNVQRLHALRKQTKAKFEKTQVAAESAIKTAEKRAKQEIKQQQEAYHKASLQRLRKTMWFEKFYWFISSENFLILAGRDANQNEILFRRYMQKNDIYVHADVHGAATCIIKNPSGEPVPPTTLHEAGQMSICRSAAWDQKVLTSAWWVNSHQVSKTAPTGEYLTQGAFMIRGKKNYLPPMKLEMGLTVLFQLADDSFARHVGERSGRRAGDDASSASPSPSEHRTPALAGASDQLGGEEEDNEYDEVDLGENGDEDEQEDGREQQDQPGQDQDQGQPDDEADEEDEGVPESQTSSARMSRKGTGFVRQEDVPPISDDEEEDNEDEEEDLQVNMIVRSAQPDADSNPPAAAAEGSHASSRAESIQDTPRTRLRRKPTGFVSLADLRKRAGDEAAEEVIETTREAEQSGDRMTDFERSGANPNDPTTQEMLEDTSISTSQHDRPAHPPTGGQRRRVSVSDTPPAIIPNPELPEIHVTWSPQIQRVIDPPKIENIHVEFDDLPPAIVPDAPEDPFVVEDDESPSSNKDSEANGDEGEGESDTAKTAVHKAKMARRATGFIRSAPPPSDDEDEDEDEEEDKGDEEGEELPDHIEILPPTTTTKDELEVACAAVTTHPEGAPSASLTIGGEPVTPAPTPALQPSPASQQPHVDHPADRAPSASGYDDRTSADKRGSSSRHVLSADSSPAQRVRRFSSQLSVCSSVDGGPPPEGYSSSEVLNPRTLLKYQSKELVEVKELLDQREPPVPVYVRMSSIEDERAKVRKNSLDGGPVPPRFSSDSLPSAKELLSRPIDIRIGSRQSAGAGGGGAKDGRPPLPPLKRHATADASTSSAIKGGGVSGSFARRHGGQRRLSADGGPLPPGYSLNTLPSVRQLLSHSSLALIEEEEGGTPAAPSLPPEPGDGGQDDVDAQDRQQEAGEEGGEEEAGKKRLSIAERKRLKKKGKATAPSGESSPPPDERPSSTESLEKPSTGAAAGASARRPSPPSDGGGVPQVPRGQRYKLKKIKDKYADQDEEERELRMQLMGSKAKQRKKGGKGDKDADKEAEISKAAEARAKQDHYAREKERQEKREVRALLQEEDEAVLEQQMAERLSEIDALTGCPLEQDTVLFAIPMVAPFSAIQTYTYKAKLTPGTGKRGKAGQQAIKVFINTTEHKAHEELMRAIQASELAQAMIGNVKVYTPGINKVMQAEKKEKKKEKKNRGGKGQQ
ncbi:unnamed protein product [Vitrella brassicaformis CCMP3155]|uniref:NFACT RNA-binding domain-containing protein n=6 Tax=Vitrella brassicaformis TaxID=1169539 RepID=A0A0G4H5J0_VITBC|nr:unnamed protein product [Vitrella brassicaformis CCMP3155]|eukprot:CEM39049.1 unnamed protein product [Vitrella brassicaformis CCMP3155]